MRVRVRIPASFGQGAAKNASSCQNAGLIRTEEGKKFKVLSVRITLKNISKNESKQMVFICKKYP